MKRKFEALTVSLTDTESDFKSATLAVFGKEKLGM
jgi:hypothetical protein